MSYAKGQYSGIIFGATDSFQTKVYCPFRPNINTGLRDEAKDTKECLFTSARL